jgi:hypothetical protein
VDGTGQHPLRFDFSFPFRIRFGIQILSSTGIVRLRAVQDGRVGAIPRPVGRYDGRGSDDLDEGIIDLGSRIFLLLGLARVAYCISVDGCWSAMTILTPYDRNSLSSCEKIASVWDHRSGSSLKHFRRNSALILKLH